jgi:hypothetical protein
MAGWQDVKRPGLRDSRLDETTLESLTDRVVDAVAEALAGAEPIAAAALQFLLRRYSTGTRSDVAEPLGAALAREVERQAEHGSPGDVEGWIAVFSEAATISEDPRLPRAVASLLTDLRSRWTAPADNVESGDRLEKGESVANARALQNAANAVGEVMHSVEACLLAVNVPEARDLAAEAIDALERVVAGAYRPGQGMSHAIGKAGFIRGGLSDHVRSASTLLTAYQLTSRLPYAMLADELIQSVLRTPPAEEEGRDRSFAVNCELARVFCRLAALHHDEEYRRTAVLAAHEDYGGDAAETLAVLASPVPERAADAALFGLALAEWLNLR